MSKSLVVLDQDSTLIVVVELSLSDWLVAGIVPGLSREPLKKLGADPEALLKLVHRWRDEAIKAGHPVKRIVLAYEAGRDGFWLARWLRGRGIEAYVIHPNSIPVPREHRRAKTDRLDTRLLKRAFLGWLRGEAGHCTMVAIPSLEEEDAKRPNREHDTLTREHTRIVNRLKSTMIRFGVRSFNPKLRKAADRLCELVTPEGVPLPANTLAELKRDMARLSLIKEQLKIIARERSARVATAANHSSPAKVKQIAQVIGMGIDTADMLVHEALSRDLSDRRAVARYAGLTGSPDESGKRRREKGLPRAGNARVRHGMIQFAWRFLRFQADSPLAQWYRSKTRSERKDVRKLMIVALARKLLIALWRWAAHGVVPDGIALRNAG
jgi:transposase